MEIRSGGEVKLIIDLDPPHKGWPTSNPGNMNWEITLESPTTTTASSAAGAQQTKTPQNQPEKKEEVPQQISKRIPGFEAIFTVFTLLLMIFIVKIRKDK